MTDVKALFTLACEGAVQLGGRWHAIGIFTTVKAEGFPLLVGPYCVFAQIAAGPGAHAITVKTVDELDHQLCPETSGALVVEPTKSGLHVSCMVAPFRSDKEQTVEHRVYVDGEWVGQVRVEVKRARAEEV